MRHINHIIAASIICSFILSSCGVRTPKDIIQFSTVFLQDTCVIGHTRIIGDTCIIDDTRQGTLIRSFDIQAVNLVNGNPWAAHDLNKLILRSLFTAQLVEDYFEDSGNEHTDMERFVDAISGLLEDDFSQELDDHISRFGWDPDEGYTQKAEYDGKIVYRKGNLLSYRWEHLYLNPEYNLPKNVNAMCCNLATMERLYLEDIFGDDPDLWYTELLLNIKELYPDDYWMIPEFLDQMEIIGDEYSEPLGNFLFEEDGMHFYIFLPTTEAFEYILPWEKISHLFSEEFANLIETTN